MRLLTVSTLVIFVVSTDLPGTSASPPIPVSNAAPAFVTDAPVIADVVKIRLAAPEKNFLVSGSLLGEASGDEAHAMLLRPSVEALDPQGFEPVSLDPNAFAEETADTAATQEALPEATEPERREYSREIICDSLVTAATEHKLPVVFFTRLIWQESRLNPEAVSRAGAQGVAQFMPASAADMGLADPFDPVQALPVSARFLRDLRRQFGNWGLAAAAYNAGPGRVRNWLARGGKLPQETRDYVMKITGHSPESWVGTGPRKAVVTTPERVPCDNIPEEVASADITRVPMPPSRPALDDAPPDTGRILVASAGNDFIPLPRSMQRAAASRDANDGEREREAAPPSRAKPETRNTPKPWASRIAARKAGAERVAVVIDVKARTLALPRGKAAFKPNGPKRSRVAAATGAR